MNYYICGHSDLLCSLVWSQTTFPLIGFGKNPLLPLLACSGIPHPHLSVCFPVAFHLGLSPVQSSPCKKVVTVTE